MGLDNDDIKQLIAILQRGLDKETIEDEQEEEIKIKPRKKSVKKTVKKSKNLFDSMSESRMHKDDIEIDKKLRVHPPTDRSRSYIPTEAQCRVCGKTETINASLIESSDRYKCNKCASSAG
jgi:hypothetical protein